MKIIDLINYYYAFYPVLNLHIEQSGGISGKTHTYTKAEALIFLRGYENEIVADMSFSTYYTFCGEVTKPQKQPHLYIMYIPE